MAVLNHTIAPCRDKVRSARFLAEMIGLPTPYLFGPFAVVEVGPDTTLDFIETDGPIEVQHYAFLVSDTEFDEVLARVEARGLSYWADPGRTQPGEVNTWDDGRGLYFADPDGHVLEIITKPYGSGGPGARNPNPLVARPLPD